MRPREIGLSLLGISFVVLISATIGVSAGLGAYFGERDRYPAYVGGAADHDVIEIRCRLDIANMCVWISERGTTQCDGQHWKPRASAGPMHGRNDCTPAQASRRDSWMFGRPEDAGVSSPIAYDECWWDVRRDELACGKYPHATYWASAEGRSGPDGGPLAP